MKRFSEQFNTKAQSVKLQAVERAELRKRVVSYIEYHPLPHTPRVRSATAPSLATSPFTEAFKIVSVPTGMIARFSAAFSVFLLIVIPALAEQAVPGDRLHAVKTRFNEEIRSSLTINQHEKVEWETERLNRRIAEARLLASEGRLTEEVEAQVAEAVREHTKNVQAEIATLGESDVDEALLASIELTTTLKVQSASLQEEGRTTLALAAANDDRSSKQPAQLLVDVLNETLSHQTATATIPAYDKIMARLEINTTRSYELFESLNLDGTESLRNELDRRLQDVNRSIEKANGERSLNEAAASLLLVDALERTQKLIVYMSDINANRAIALETVVPVILTEREEAQQLAMLESDISRKVEILETVRPQLTAPVAEKVDFSIQAAATTRGTATSGNERTSKEAAKSTVALLDDAIRLVEASGVDTTTAIVVDTGTTTDDIFATGVASTTKPAEKEEN